MYYVLHTAWLQGLGPHWGKCGNEEKTETRTHRQKVMIRVGWIFEEEGATPWKLSMFITELNRELRLLHTAEL